MISSFFKTRKPKQFSPIPRYYNAEKEEFEKRIAEIKAEVNQSGQGSFSQHRPNLKAKWTAHKKTSHYNKKSNLRLIVIAALLFAISYYLLFQ